MGKHAKKVLASTTMPDDQVPGLTWDITVVPDTDCTDGLDMYQGHGTLWQWVIIKVTPIIDGHAYAGAHGGTVGYGHMRNGQGWMAADLDTLINGNRWYIYGKDRLTRADECEVIPPIVPVLIEQAREALPDVISRHSWQARAVADKITDLTLGEWTDDQDDQDAMPGYTETRDSNGYVTGHYKPAGWAERALAEAVDGARALAEDGVWHHPTDAPDDGGFL